jgi:hypothetical protein
MQQSEKTATRRTNCVACREVFLLDSKHTARATRQVIILNEETVMSEVGTRKLFENDRVIVWDFVLEAGEKTTVHTHTHDYVFCVLEAGGGEELFDANDTFLGAGEIKSGETHYVELQGKELVSDFMRYPASHALRNSGNTRYREIVIELK